MGEHYEHVMSTIAPLHEPVPGQPNDGVPIQDVAWAAYRMIDRFEPYAASPKPSLDSFTLTAGVRHGTLALGYLVEAGMLEKIDEVDGIDAYRRADPHTQGAGRRAALERIIARAHPRVSDLVDTAERILERYGEIAGDDGGEGARYHELARGVTNGRVIIGYLADAGVFEQVDHTGEQGVPLRYTLDENVLSGILDTPSGSDQ